MGAGNWGVQLHHCRDGRLRTATEMRRKRVKFTTRLTDLEYADDLTILQQGREKFNVDVQELFSTVVVM